ncbi:MAG TPA: hypothetical protein VIM79_07505 [Niastella sp.]
MKRISCLSFVVVIILLACKGKQEGRPSGREALKAFGLVHDTLSLKALVADITKTNVLMGGAVGIDGRRPEQWDRFDLLRTKASDQELIALTDDTNAVVRCYAFQALAEKNYVDVYPIVICHLSDTATVRTINGCLIGSKKAGDLMLDGVYSKCGQDGNRHLNTDQREVVDSLLIYGNDNRLDKRNMVLSRIEPAKRYYVGVRRLATVEKNKEAVVALSKYRKKSDIPIIKEFLNDPHSQKFGFAAVKNFPDPSFYPYLEKALKDEIKNDKENDVQELYYAIVQYKNKASRELLKFALSEAKDMKYIHHSDYLSQALREYPAPIYEGLVKPIYTGRPLR